MFNINSPLNHTNCTQDILEGDKKTTVLLWTIVQLLIFSLIIATAFLGNILVCTAVYKFSYLQTTTNYAIVSLAITDIFMVYVMILHATTVVKGKWTLGITLCDVTSTIGLTLNLVSLVHLTYISLDRYIAIVKPFRYQVWITKSRVVVIMVVLWVTTCLVLNLPWADFKYRSNVFGCLKNVKRGNFRLSTLLFLLAFVSLPTAFILFTYISIYRIARGHAVRLQKQESNLNTSFQQNPDALCELSIRNNKTALNGFKRELKSVKTFAIIVGCFLICYIPFYTVATTRSFQGLDSVPKPVLITVTWFAFVNSCINPILYSLQHHQFKKAFKKIFCRGITRVLPIHLESRRLSSTLMDTSRAFNETAH